MDKGIAAAPKADGFFKLNNFRMAAIIAAFAMFFIALTRSGHNISSLFLYVSPLIFAVIGCGFYNGDYMRKKRHLLCMGFFLWYVLCRWLCGDFFMLMPEEQYTFIMTGMMLALALPFSDIMGDSERRRYLNILCWVVVLSYAVLLCLCYAARFRGENIVFVKGLVEFGVTVGEKGDTRVLLFNAHHYTVDYIAALCFLLTLYLAFSTWQRAKWLIIPELALLVIFAYAAVIIPCRTVLVAICGALLLVALIFIQRIRLPKTVLIGGFILLCAAGAAFVLFGMDSVYMASTNDARSALSRLATMSGRSELWSAALQILRDDPIGYLRGFSLGEMLERIMEYDPRGMGHLHNGLLEVLLFTGIPGFAAVLAFCVVLIVSCVRVFFAPAQSSISTAHKVMVAAVAALFFMNLFDSLLFINRSNCDMLNFFFFVFCGYIFDAAGKLREEKRAK